MGGQDSVVAQGDLWEVTSHLDAVLDSLADHAILTLDVDGVVTSWNRAAEQTKGYTRDEIIGQHFSLFYSDDDRKFGEPGEALRTAAASGRYETEGWRYRKDGSSFWANVVIQPLKDRDGTVQGFVKVTRDVSDRLHLDKLRDELQQSQKLELVGQLTGGVAHDFNNLLTAIESTFQLIRNITKDSRVERYLDINRIAIDRSRKLIAQLLAFSRKQVLNPKLSNINEVASVFDVLLQRAVGERIRINWRLAPKLPLVNIDPGHLQSALLNLVVNARDAMPNGGLLTIFTEVRTLPPNAHDVPFDLPAGVYVALGVADSGTGMTPDVRRRAVEPFFTTKDIGKGTGLGLSQCFGFARQSGGTLTIESIVGSGTTVSIILPVAKGQSLAKADGAKTILLVEDDEAVRALTADVLRMLGHVVLEAADASDAISQIQKDLTIDYLFSDIIMPNDMNGVELVMKARTLRPELSALLASGYPRDTLRETMNLPEDVAFLQKPYTMSDLMTKFGGAVPTTTTPA